MNFQPYAISQSQLLSAFMPEQILRGKVLEILPDRNALLQLGNRQVVAKVGAIDPPLKTGQEYLFQIQQHTNPLVAKVVARQFSAQPAELAGSTMVDDVLHALELKNEPATRALIQSFLDKGDPLTRESLIEARALLGSGTPAKEDVDAVRWMLQRRLPLSKSFLQIAQMMNKQEQPIAGQLADLSRILQDFKGTPSTDALQQSIRHLTSVANESHMPLSLLTAEVGEKQAAEQIQALAESFGASDRTAIQVAASRLLHSGMSDQDISKFLKNSQLNLPPAFFADKLSNGLQQVASVRLTALDGAEQPALLFRVMKQIGLDFEGSIRQQLVNEQAPIHSGTVKEALLAVVQDAHVPGSIRQSANAIIGQITGEQLQMLSPDSVAAQFTLQLPLPMQQNLANLTVYWEGKKDKKGQIDSDYCTLLLCLDLQHLKETRISVRVQNRVVTLRVQNDHADLKPFLKENQELLATKLEQLAYHLNSIAQVEQLDDQLVARASQPLTPLTYRLDVKA